MLLQHSEFTGNVNPAAKLLLPHMGACCREAHCAHVGSRAMLNSRDFRSWEVLVSLPEANCPLVPRGCVVGRPAGGDVAWPSSSWTGLRSAPASSAWWRRCAPHGVWWSGIEPRLPAAYAEGCAARAGGHPPSPGVGEEKPGSALGLAGSKERAETMREVLYDAAGTPAGRSSSDPLPKSLDPSLARSTSPTSSPYQASPPGPEQRVAEKRGVLRACTAMPSKSAERADVKLLRMRGSSSSRLGFDAGCKAHSWIRCLVCERSHWERALKEERCRHRVVKYPAETSSRRR